MSDRWALPPFSPDPDLIGYMEESPKRTARRRARALRKWVEKARKEDTCSMYGCTRPRFPYCAEHDAP